MTTARLLSLEWALHWDSAVGRHVDRYFAPKANLWRDFFPGRCAQGLTDLQPGDVYTETMAPGDLIETRDANLVAIFRPDQFTGPGGLQPRAGRFYPRGFTPGVAATYKGDMRPFRFLGQQENTLLGDYNHPLAGRVLELAVQVVECLGESAQRGGRAQDYTQLLADNGPGMQIPYEDLTTDFFAGQPFARADERDDALFYQQTRLVHHLDAACRAQVTDIYRRLLQPEMRVLDLMSSWTSYLPEDIPNLQVTGLGMNRDELEHNPALTTRLVHDLNTDPRLPLLDREFDLVICTASIEYLTRPFEVMAEAARVLKPGGMLAVTFSNRWFPPKAIQLWSELHPYERLGLVLAYFLRDNHFSGIHTETLHGLLRPADDPHAANLPFSDPLFAVWAHKR